MARYENKDGKWKVIIELGRDERTNQRKRHTKAGFSKKKDAIAYANKMENELLNGMIFNKTKILLKDFISEWYDRQIKDSYSINTITNYSSRINQHIIPYFADIELSKIKPANVQAFYYHLIDNSLNPDSAKRVIRVLNKCLTYAFKLKLINNIPCDIEYKNIANNKKKLNVLDEDQLIYLIDELYGTYLYFPVMFDAFTGLRIGELCGLRWCNVDNGNSTIHICEQVINDKINKTLIHTEMLKTSKSCRKITIPKFLNDILKSIKPNDKLLKCKINDFVFLSRNNDMCNPRNLSMDFTKKIEKYIKPIDELSEKELNMFDKYIQLPKISFHDLRHTHATLLMKHGENIKVISDRLGHESIKITLDTYSHVLPSMEEHTALLLDSLYSNRIKK